MWKLQSTNRNAAFRCSLACFSLLKQTANTLLLVFKRSSSLGWGITFWLLSWGSSSGIVCPTAKMSRSKYSNCIYWRKKNHLRLEGSRGFKIAQDFTSRARETNISLDNIDMYWLEATLCVRQMQWRWWNSECTHMTFLWKWTTWQIKKKLFSKPNIFILYSMLISCLR